MEILMINLLMALGPIALFALLTCIFLKWDPPS